MIIAHFARACYPFHPYGGLEQHVYQYSSMLAQLGHTVHLFTQPPDKGLPPEDFKWPEGVQHHYLPYHVAAFLRRNSIPDRLVNYPLFSLRLAAQLRKVKPAPQVVYAQGLAAFGYSLRPLPGVPLILNPQGMEEFKNRSRAKQVAYGPFRGMVRYAAGRSAAVLATDWNLQDEVIRNLKVSPDKVYMVQNSVDLQSLDRKLQEAIPPDTGQGETSLLLLSVGRLEENKGYKTGLQALKSLLETQPDLFPPGWKWVLVGEGSQKSTLEHETRRLGLSGNVVFAGALPDSELYRLYRAADVFLHPTLYEGSSLVTLEAMSAGLPVVASAVGGLPDKVVTYGKDENGRLAKPGDAEDFAQNLKALLEMPGQSRVNLGRNGRKRVEQFFSLRASAQNLVELFESLRRPVPVFGAASI